MRILKDPPARYRALTPAGRRFIVAALAVMAALWLSVLILSGAWQQRW